MKRFRTLFFWAHLAAGLVAGLSIAVMCLTGAALAFEKQLVAWAERDARRITPPAPGLDRLPLEELARHVREKQPDARPTGITLSSNPHDAVAFALSRDTALYANPYTGEVRAPASTAMHDLMHVLEDWHRVLARKGDQRPIGKAINGACNLAFAFLAVSGLYLWWPRSWSRRGVKAIAVFNWRLVGKARDFNWHNAVGLWCAPVLVVLTLTAAPISYRWGGTLIYWLAGETPPAQAAPGGPMGASSAPSVEVQRPSPEAQPLPQAELVARVQAQFPRWQLITVRTGGANRGGARPATGQASPAAEEASREGRAATAQAVTVTVREHGSWPRTATTTLTLNPFTGETLKREGHADLTAARRIRSWTRFLHTGEALGLAGQLVAGLASLGGALLVYTGFALSYRRFFRRPSAKASADTTNTH